MSRMINLILITLTLAGIYAEAQPPKVEMDITNQASFWKTDGVSVREDHLVFDGKSGIFELKDYYQPQGSFSISIWIKPIKETRAQTFLIKGETCPDGNPNFKGLSMFLGLTSDMNLTGTLVSGSGKQLTGSLVFQTQAALVPDVWQSITAVFDADSVAWSAYINGEKAIAEQSFQPSREAFQQVAPSNDAFWRLGARESHCNYVHAYDEYYNGAIRRLKIYDYKLAVDAIQTEANYELNKNTFIWGGAAALLLLGFFVWRFFKKRVGSN